MARNPLLASLAFRIEQRTGLGRGGDEDADLVDLSNGLALASMLAMFTRPDEGLFVGLAVKWPVFLVVDELTV